MTRIRSLPSRAAALAGALLIAAFAPGAESADRYWPPIVDPPTGQFTPGRWVWADLVTSDVGTAAAFYGKVFGWTFETYGGEDDRDTYTLVLADGLPIGGMVFDPRAMKGTVPSARWVGLISVGDVRAATDAVAGNGGKVVYAPVMLGERGETAVFQDPEGNLFGVVRSKNGDPADFAGDLNEWVWVDLWTGDVGQATKFYSAVAGYQVVPVPENNGRGGAHLVAGGYARAGVIVRVADAGATVEQARAAGGRVIRTPVNVGPAIVAIITDPTGAPVGVAQLPGREAQ